ncbi:STE12 [[Candida] subhashii]|uniref:STE12 n=1 Tax=[Candida] subhashii TaxID=561895 RepID=A0A8J5QKM1_9ASCO|nr:STE12 [[Candida] subhashii]KAG7662332.1 STE12 [[Candida] subhashii]
METNSNNGNNTNNSQVDVKESLRLIEDLKFFLATAPANWQENQVIRRYYLNSDEGFVSCVYWNNLYFITGTDIVRCIVYKFEHFGRKIIDRKKFEEGIFSDLRNLKIGTDAILEPPRSEFLEFLFKNSCLRTQKKQKVFFWFNVPHDKLMADALERDLKKEKVGQNPTTIACKEPALSFNYDESQNLYSQLAKHMEIQKGLNDLGTNDDNNNYSAATTSKTGGQSTQSSPEYISTNRAVKREEEFGYLNQETPSQYKTASDYEDDFPLDYLNQNGNAPKQDEYITLDSNYHPGTYLEENYESFLDSTLFVPPSATLPTSANPVAFNDEYLIEQTQPLKTPLLPISASALQPRSAKYLSIRSSKGEEFFPQTIPLSAKYQTTFGPAQLATPAYFKPQPTTYLQPPSATIAQFYDSSSVLYPTEIPVQYNVIHPESEYWTNIAPATATTYTPAYDAFSMNQQVMYMNNDGDYQSAYNNGMVNMVQRPPLSASTQYFYQPTAVSGKHNSRQQPPPQQPQQQGSVGQKKQQPQQQQSAVSSKIMKNKKIQQQQQQQIHQLNKKGKQVYETPNDLLNSQATRIVNMARDKVAK